LTKYNKYSNKKTKVGEYTFDSKREATRYMELRLMVMAKEIRDLTLQPTYMLQEGYRYNGKKIREITYVADFRYTQNGKIVVEDTKGFKTEIYRLKKKLFLFKYPDIIFVES